MSSIESENPYERMNEERGLTALSSKDLNFDNLVQYYGLKIEGINYFSRSIWEALIKFEQSKDKQLKLLYKTLEDNYYPGSNFSKINKCFPIITSILFSDIQTRNQAIHFIMTHAGRMGLINIIHVFALIGDDISGKNCVEKLLTLCEAMVYPTSDYKKEFNAYANRYSSLIQKVCNSKIKDWDTDTEHCMMTYLPDFKVTIQWEAYEDQEPFYEEWATNHPDKNARSVNYYLYYEDSLIKTFKLVYIDGYRALLPMPNHEKHIRRRDYQFSCLVNSNIDNLNDYIARSKLIVD